MAPVTADSVAEVVHRLSGVRDRVNAAGGDPDRIRIVAVTKGWGPETVQVAVAAGLCDLGENYAQELLTKAAAVPGQVRWHFLGRVQRNKVTRLAPLIRTWHSIDRPAAADAVAAASPGVEVLVQVNVTGAAGRPGCRPEQVDALVGYCRDRRVRLTGLMAVGPAGDRPRTRECFRWLAQRARQLDLQELSMGMSDDYEIAVAEGATTLRLGRVLYGPRQRIAAVQR
jgi:pyridoxal phosphate enzyme (YggS family)